MDALTKRILEYVRNNPGKTTADILASLSPRYSHKVAWLHVVYLSSIYEIENRGGAGRHEDVKWHILEWKPTAFYFEVASDIIRELKSIPPRKQALFLARRLQELNEDNKNTL